VDSVISWHTTTRTIAGRAETWPQGASAVIEEGQLPILKPGTVLEAGGIYLDLSKPARGPFRALPGQVAGSGNRYIAKRDVPCEIWFRLVEAAAVAGQTGEPVPVSAVAAMIATLDTSTTNLADR
jgi:hypothetical protein